MNKPLLSHSYGISDGDGLSVSIPVRLWGCDAPEWNQKHGSEAKVALRVRTEGRPVIIEPKGVDCYGRLLARVLVKVPRKKPVDVSDWLVRNGHAWATEDRYRESQVFAESHGLGLWKNPNPIPPWKFRARGRSRKFR